ncbi:hypothetical protein EIP86_009425 [Pleurotus ostreatoroseus]|nr:hypothetical protein EIP86_009425 [Pleurotus ostreatoroseus]
MGPRHAAHVVDKVGGITHMLATNKIPIYVRGDPSSAAEDAWNLLIPVMHPEQRAELFFLYPARGDRKGSAWYLSWDQINGPLPHVSSFTLRGDVNYRKEYGLFLCQGWLIKDCVVQGLGIRDREGHCRTGTLRIARNGAKHSFRVAAHHQERVPNGSYALIGERSRGYPFIVAWTVGTFNADTQFEKVSVLRTEDGDDMDRMYSLGLIGKWSSSS